MIDIHGLRTDILNAIKVYSGANEAIFANQKGPRPKEPYLSLKVIVPYAETADYPIEEKNIVPSQNPSFESDIECRYITFPSITISVVVYGDEDFIIVQKAREWFSTRKASLSILEKHQAVVREVTAVQNRDSIIGRINYERKQGFDVIIEVRDVVKVVEDTIEVISIKEVG